jgi:hypothetical protein
VVGSDHNYDNAAASSRSSTANQRQQVQAVSLQADLLFYFFFLVEGEIQSVDILHW